MKKFTFILLFCSTQMFAQVTCERKPADLQNTELVSIQSIHNNLNSENGIGLSDKNTKTGKVDPARVMSLYPDPFSSSIHVSIPGNRFCFFKISDLTGRTIITKEISGETDQFDLSFLPAGVYYASVTGERLLKSGIFVKK